MHWIYYVILTGSIVTMLLAIAAILLKILWAIEDRQLDQIMKDLDKDGE